MYYDKDADDFSSIDMSNCMALNDDGTCEQCYIGYACVPEKSSTPWVCTSCDVCEDEFCMLCLASTSGSQDCLVCNDGYYAKSSGSCATCPTHCATCDGDRC